MFTTSKFNKQFNKINQTFNHGILSFDQQHVNKVFFSDRIKFNNQKNLIKNLSKNSAVIFREYDLNFPDRYSMAIELKKILNPKNKFLVAKDFTLVKKIKADGIHFSDLDKKIPINFLNKKSFPKNFIFSLALHPKNNFRSLGLIKKYQPDWIFISPIFATTSHVNQSSIGIIKFSKLIFKIKNFACKNKKFMPKIYALGGINFGNLKILSKLQISGFGAIDLFKNL